MMTFHKNKNPNTDTPLPSTASIKNPIIETKELSVSYGKAEVLSQISLSFSENSVTALIGPSGCGKSSFLRCINRMNEFIPSFHHTGDILFHGQDVYHKNMRAEHIRRNIGMVFQKPNPFPKSILNNITWALRLHGYRGNFRERAEHVIRRVGLWDEVSRDLNRSALELSGGQQQRLCIARAIVIEPEVILMDEPCSALDPRATARIEELIADLRKDYTIIIVTHNMQQAARISDNTAFFNLGKLAEYAQTSDIFQNPKSKETEAYITGRFG